MVAELGNKSSDELVIEQALKKREELTKIYKKEESSINPLLLIQLPDNKNSLLNKNIEFVVILTMAESR